MTVFLRILIVLCSLTTAAHFLRFGTLWDAAPALLPAAAAFFPRLLPRPLLVLTRELARQVFVTLAASLHVVFLEVARI